MKKKIAFLLSVLILAGAFAMMVFTANAATDSTTDTAVSSAVTSSTTDTTTATPNTTDKQTCDNFGRKEKLQLTEAQKAEMKAKMDAQKAKTDAQVTKWNALTDAQKAEIYAIQDQKATIEKQQVDKYLELGIIDSDTATQMKKDIDTRTTEIKESGKLPMMGNMGDKRGGKCGPPPIAGETK